MSRCPGCGARYSGDAYGLGGHEQLRSCDACWAEVGELTSYIAGHPAELESSHQAAVDSYSVQHWSSRMPAIRMAFALNGLYLVVERGWSGLQARAAHVYLGRTVSGWPTFVPPGNVGSLTVQDVRTTSPAACAIDIAAWAQSVWLACEELHHDVATMTDRQLERPAG